MRNILALMFALAFSLPAAAEGVLTHYPNIASQHLPPREVTVWTPEGYDPKAGPLPVIYMQDGENLYDAKRSLSHASWEVDQTVSRLIRQGRIPPVIIVGVASTPLRGREYLPNKIVSALPDAFKSKVASSWGGDALGDAYLDYLIKDVKPFVDAHYATRRDAAGTFIIGSSMGGLIALYAQGEHPEVFGGSASLSMHVLLGGPPAMTALTNPSEYRSAVAQAFGGWLSKAALRPSCHRVYIDNGDRTLDAFYAGYGELISADLKQRGWTPDRDFEWKYFPGAAHSEVDWSKRLEVPLEYLLGGCRAARP
jgi:hypothetical protein